MAKLTLSFKGHHISIHHLDDKPTTIGRDADCRICIDSLAVGPWQAELVPSEDGYLLLSLDPDYPVQLNNEQVDQASLRHGDIIQVGKHTLAFSEDSLELAPPRSVKETGTEETEEKETSGEAARAYMQIQSGPRIGRVVVFRRGLTELKHVGADGVVVTNKGNSYKLIRLKEQARIRIDGIPVADGEMDVILRDKCLVEIDNVRFQFFIEPRRGSHGAGRPD